mgnify:CR=1 FL=1
MIIFKLKKSTKVSIKVARLIDSEFLFNLFNRSIEEGFSITKKKINYASHKIWYKNRLKDKNTQVYIIYLNLDKIGYVRFEKFSKNKYKVSIANHPKFLGKGFGAICLKLAIKKFTLNKVNVKIIALINKNNIPSIKIFIKNNFKIKKKTPKLLIQKPVNNLLCYEFENKTKKNKILFLGYNNKKTNLIKFLKQKNFTVIQHGNKNLTSRNLNEYLCIISFGYKKIIKENIISKLNKPILNLHIAYLPYNRGAHPNYWSFIEKTPNGVSIHEIDQGIDTGKLILRKKIMFENIDKKTFLDTYETLKISIEKLFMQNYLYLLNGLYKPEKLKLTKSFHLKRQLPENFINWNINILEYLKKTL